MIAFLDLLDTDEEKEKFKLLYHQYVKLAYWVAMQRLHNHELAEECVQETFFSIARNFHKVGEVMSPMTKGYICTIAEGFAIKAYNKEHRATFISLEDEDAPTDSAASEESFDILHIDEMDLSFAIDHLLTDEERNLVHLKYTYGFKVSELARMFQTTDYFINKTLNRALEKLKNYFTKEN